MKIVIEENENDNINIQADGKYWEVLGGLFQWIDTVVEDMTEDMDEETMKEVEERCKQLTNQAFNWGLENI